MSDVQTEADPQISEPTPAKDTSRVRDFWALLKPRVMSLVVFSGFAGMWVAPGFSDMHPFMIAVAVACLAIGAGAAGAVNMWYERDIDTVMKRTAGRPLPRGRMNPDEAVSFALVLSALSVMTMGVAVNWTAAGLLAFANLFYSIIYTMWLKRRTPQNIVIGGAAGAFPPMIGWAAVTGTVTIESIVLFALIFFWTPPHFWALSLFANEDYKRANIPMMTVVAGERKTKIQMLVYTLILLPLSLLPTLMGFAGYGYGIAALILSGFFVFTSIRVLMDDSLKSARLMFGYSVFYLFALFLALMIDAV
ncbi:heme o synthase [Micavibrio aeruginosavorus]|uniref:Protoheme IX farnesyltransferase n=1 Tax=Micavibrio aeruginosavorus (strain ARL-13) TaxID=856793 RepID=G2KQ51_MICAA|nr:heme o synthase [Micavibrio aeruginosavorus]AEP08593.1 protoheme IX farnesyltransferase [Micavibrio aeruginosavorus ARL-13]